MSTPDPFTLVLVGPMGAGKTSIGRRVARRLHVPFVDTDKRIVTEHGPIPEIFAAHGEARFRELERYAVADALGADGVISLGGGAVTQAETRALLRAHPVAFLTVDADAVARRIRGGIGGECESHQRQYKAHVQAPSDRRSLPWRAGYPNTLLVRCRR